MYTNVLRRTVRANTRLDTIWTMLFHGENVVVTGGANGIGLAISRNIVAAGDIGQ